jgi:hypothetical protein
MRQGMPIEPHGSLLADAADVFAAGQQMILDRIDLLQAEATGEAQRLGVVAGLLVAAAFFGALAWAVLSAAGAALLNRWLPLDASLGIVAAANFALAGGIGYLGYKRLSAPSVLDRPYHGSVIPVRENGHA